MRPSGLPEAEPGGAAVLTSTTDGHPAADLGVRLPPLEMHKLVAQHRWVPRIADLVRRPAGGQARHEADRKAGLSPCRRDPPEHPWRQDHLRRVREETRDLARWLELDVTCMHERQPAPRTAYQQGVSGHPAFRTCPGQG